MTQTNALHPSILWAQRNDTVLLSVNVNDICDEKFSLEDKVFKFSGTGGSEKQQYSVELEFYKEVVPQESKHKKTARGLYFVIKKKQPGPYWPRLLSSSKKHLFIHTDFSRWKDEDESEEEGESPYDDSNLSALMQQMGGGAGLGGGLGGLGGLGGALGGGGGGGLGPQSLADLEDSDSDDEPLPDLEQ